MGLRSLFAMMFAVAMLLAPLAVRSGSAMATAPAAGHHARMATNDHCGEQPAKKQDGKSDDKSCCVAMCTAIAVAPVTPIKPQSLASSAKRPSLDQFERSYLAELPTPPPRRA